MLTDDEKILKKENLNYYLNELSKEYKKLVGRKGSAEIILIGGAAVIENYDFRDMTTDIDAILNASSAMKDAINRIRDRFELPNGWMNDDFKNTDSYSGKLIQYSSFYKTFNQVLNVRIVTGEYLIAMKLRSFRKYKNDLSDIIGILNEHEKRGNPISFEMIERAVIDLYGSWENYPKGAKEYITETVSAGNYEEVYKLVRQNEKEAKKALIDFEEKYPGVLKTGNVDMFLEDLRKRKQ